MPAQFNSSLHEGVKQARRGAVLNARSPSARHVSTLTIRSFVEERAGLFVRSKVSCVSHILSIDWHVRKEQMDSSWRRRSSTGRSR